MASKKSNNTKDNTLKERNIDTASSSGDGDGAGDSGEVVASGYLNKVVILLAVLPIVLGGLMWYVSLPIKHPSALFYQEGVVFGHNGGGDDRPEDTLMSIEYAKEKGAMGVEVDIRISSDGTLIAIHDPTLERTTNGSGFVGSHDLHTLRTLNAAHHWPQYKNKGIKIPKISEVVDLITKLELFPSLLEIKDGSDMRICPLVAKLFQENPLLYSRVVIMSFFPTQLYRLHQIDGNISTALLVSHDVISMGCHDKFFTNDVVCWCAPVLDKILWWVSRHIFRHIIGVGGISVRHSTAVAYLDVVQEWQNEGLFINVYHSPKAAIPDWLKMGFSVTPDVL